MPRWARWIALGAAGLAIGLATIEMIYRYYYFPRAYPVIAGNLQRQQELTRQGIFELYASLRYAHFDEALPQATSPADLQLVRVLPAGGGACNQLLFTYRYADGRLWCWDIHTDTRGYPVFDMSKPSLLAAGTPLGSAPWLQIPSENCVESPQW